MTHSKIIAAVAIIAAAAAFAMALRDRHRDGPDGFESDRRALEEQTAIATEQREREALHERDREQLVATIAGAHPGQPGSLFDAVHVGSAGFMMDAATEARLRDFATQRGGHLAITNDAELGPELAIAFEDRGDVWLALRDRWGEPPSGETVWIDEDDRLAVTALSLGDDISLAWHPFETIDHMIAAGDPTRVGDTPFSVVGAPIDELRRLLGRRLVADGDEYTWTLPPMRDSTLRDRAELTVAGGVVTRVRLQFDVPPDDVLHALRDAYGPGVHDLGPWRHGELEITIEGHPPDGAVVYAARAR